MALPIDHVREIKRLVDGHARKGTLRMTLVGALEQSLSFPATSQEADFLNCYTIWRLNHPIAGTRVAKTPVPPMLLLAAADLFVELFPLCLA